MKHPERIIEEETPFETGERSTYLRYDAVEEMLRGQVKGFNDQAIKDGEKNRQKLEELGFEVSEKLNEVADLVARMWKISEPHMKSEDKL